MTSRPPRALLRRERPGRPRALLGRRPGLGDGRRPLRRHRARTERRHRVPAPFLPSQEKKTVANQMHFDLTSKSLDDQRRVGGEGARARRPAHRHRPAPGRGACGPRRPRGQRVLRRSSRATTSSPTADSSERSRATARRRSGTSGAGRSAGRWSGTRTRRPRSARRTAVRDHVGRPAAGSEGREEPAALRLAPPADGDQQAEVDRLVSLGATRIDIGQGEVDWVVMADPDGNEFCVLPPR